MQLESRPMPISGPREAQKGYPLRLKYLAILLASTSSLSNVESASESPGATSPAVATRSAAPDIKANGSDGPIALLSSDNLSVTVSLASGVDLGNNADSRFVCE